MKEEVVNSKFTEKVKTEKNPFDFVVRENRFSALEGMEIILRWVGGKEQRQSLP